MTAYPVIYAPGHEVIGHATTERGAKQVVARRVYGLLPCERWTASLRERLDGSQAWFTGPQLITGGR